MRKLGRIFFIGVIVILAGISAFAQTRDNFSARGIELYGGVTGFFDKNYVLDPNAVSFSASVSVDPGLEVFIADGLGFFFEPSFSFSRQYTDAFNEWNSLSYGATLGVDYWLLIGDNPIFIPSLGVSGGAFLVPGSWGVRSGDVYTNLPLTMRWEIGLPVSFNFFVTDHIALYLGVNPTLRISYLLTNTLGEPFTDTTPFMDRFGINVYARVGIRFFFPDRDVILVKF